MFAKAIELWLPLKYRAHRRSLLIFLMALFLMCFLCTFYFILSSLIDFPNDQKVLVTLEPINFYGNPEEYKWSGCRKYDEFDEYRNLPPEDRKELDGVCFLKVDLKDTRLFSGVLNIDTTILQREICIIGDEYAGFIPEQERANGSSIWDSRKFGKLTKDDKCLVLRNISDEEIYIPVKIFPGLVKYYLVRQLVEGWKALVVVYLLSFTFSVAIWKAAFDFAHLLKALFK